MRKLWLTFFFFFCCYQRSLSDYYSKRNKLNSQWIVSVEVNNKRVCPGLLVGNDWVLVIGTCILKSNIKQFRVTMDGGNVRRVLGKTRSPIGKAVALLQMESQGDQSDDGQKYQTIGSNDLTPEHKGTILIYSWQKAAIAQPNEIDLISDDNCLKKEGFKRNQHDCFTMTSKPTPYCKVEAGLPIFGKLKGEWIFHGFSSTKTDICNNHYKQATIILPHREWIENVLEGCGLITTIENGQIVPADQDGGVVGSNGNVLCDSEYEPSSTSVRCKANGQWKKASCKMKDCGAPKPISNGIITPVVSTTYGSEATVTCEKEFAENQKTVLCTENGWEVATCDIIDCGKPVSINNGIVTPVTSTTFGSKATVTCDKGFIESQNEVTCMEDGWEIATCNMIDCGTPLPISNMLFEYSSTILGAKAVVVCDEEYYTTKSEIECTSSGWETTTCTIACTQPVQNGKFMYRLCHGNGVGHVNHASGLLQLKYDRHWGLVCDDQWDDVDATLVCKILGFSSGKGHGKGYFNNPTTPSRFFLDQLRCTSLDNTLYECYRSAISSTSGGYKTTLGPSFYQIGVHDCSIQESAGVTCS